MEFVTLGILNRHPSCLPLAVTHISPTGRIRELAIDDVTQSESRCADEAQLVAKRFQEHVANKLMQLVR